MNQLSLCRNNVVVTIQETKRRHEEVFRCRGSHPTPFAWGSSKSKREAGVIGKRFSTTGPPVNPCRAQYQSRLTHNFSVKELRASVGYSAAAGGVETTLGPSLRSHLTHDTFNARYPCRRLDVRPARNGEDDARQGRRGRVQDNVLQRQRLYTRLQVPRRVREDGPGPVRDGPLLRAKVRRINPDQLIYTKKPRHFRETGLN